MTPNLALLPGWMAKLVLRPAPAAPSSLMMSRIEVCPPQRWASSFTWRGRMQRWLETSRLLPERHRPVNRLAVAREDFLVNLDDIDNPESRALADRVARARSLRELWHLRLSVYGAVARAVSQAEAEARLAVLNRHFPVRAPRPITVAASVADS